MVALLLALGCAHAPPEATAASPPVTIELQGTSVDLYLPDTDTPAPMVVLAHGLARDRASMAGWGRRLAERGYVAVVPDLPMLADPERSAATIVGLVRSVESAPALDERIDDERTALIGISAGGLATLLAAEEARADLWIGLDPVEHEGLGARAAAELEIPALVLLAQPSACNAQGNGEQISDALADQWLQVRMRNGTHCDLEASSDPSCTALCGERSEDRHAAFARYALAALDVVLIEQGELDAPAAIPPGSPVGSRRGSGRLAPEIGAAGGPWDTSSPGLARLRR